MRRVHCRQCWQTTTLLTRRCTHCGASDLPRFARGVIELGAWLMAGVLLAAVAGWCAMLYI